MQEDLHSLQIAVVGTGSFGTALAGVIATNGHVCTLIGRNMAVVKEINRERTNAKYLPGVQIADNVIATTDWLAILEAELIVIAVPSHAMRETCRLLQPFYRKGTIVVHVTKGLEMGTRARMSAVILEEIPTLAKRDLAVLSGPSHAEEIARSLPTTLVVSSAAKTTAEFVQDTFMNRFIRVYTNPDVMGTELGGALKNIIAIGCGISDGLDFGDNAKAALMTRGLVEIARLGVRMGAAKSTFFGLTGIGDLIVTCTSKHSRNWNFGYLLGLGVSVSDALMRVGMVVEGVRTAQSAIELAAENRIAMPISESIGDILFKEKKPVMAVTELMARTRTHETEEHVEDTTAAWEFT